MRETARNSLRYSGLLFLQENSGREGGVVPTVILYIDDDSDDQLFFGEAVQRIAPEAVCYFAYDGIDALGLPDRMTVLPDIIFLDLNMPRLPGKEFLKKIRISDHGNIKVIVFTTSVNRQDIEECKQLGVIHYISKPNSFMEIIDALKRFIH